MSAVHLHHHIIINTEKSTEMNTYFFILNDVTEDNQRGNSFPVVNVLFCHTYAVVLHWDNKIYTHSIEFIQKKKIKARKQQTTS